MEQRIRDGNDYTSIEDIERIEMIIDDIRKKLLRKNVISTIQKGKIKMKAEKEIDMYIQEVQGRISRIIHETRTKKKITLREIYRKTGICIACVSQLENGTNPPRLAIVIRLALFLGIPLKDLLGEKII